MQVFGVDSDEPPGPNASFFEEWAALLDREDRI